MDRKELLNKLIHERNLKEYDLEKGFEQFEKNYFECIGTSAIQEEPKWEKFNWLTENDENITVEIAIQHKQVDTDEFEFEYQLYKY